VEATLPSTALTRVVRLRLEKNKAAGEALPPSKLLTGPASPRRSVCALEAMSLHSNAGSGEIVCGFDWFSE
jgi:hypothetical protein